MRWLDECFWHPTGPARRVSYAKNVCKHTSLRDVCVECGCVCMLCYITLHPSILLKKNKHTPAATICDTDTHASKKQTQEVKSHLGKFK